MEKHHGAQHQSTAQRSTGTTTCAAWMDKLAGAGEHGLLASPSLDAREKQVDQNKERLICCPPSWPTLTGM